MSILFYRRPDFCNKPNVPINSSDCARYVERAIKSERSIPPGLGFKDVINNKALPPCSLNDFMSYLIHVEHNAENLQFFLWYQDYVRRFNALPAHQCALSPEWIPEKTPIPALSAKDSERQPPRSRTKGEILTTMLSHGYDPRESTLFREDGNRPSSLVADSNASSIAPSILYTAAEINSQAGLKWQPFTIQPMREEINRIMRNYLAFTAPRELNLSHGDRAACFYALQHTTHPSALRPALLIATSALRGQSHPNFIRYSICNGNRPRVLVVRTLGFITTSLGFILAIILLLSSASRYWRFFASIFWFIGLTTCIAAWKGLCIVLHYGGGGRMVREWELGSDAFSDAEGGAGAGEVGDGVELAGGGENGSGEGRSRFFERRNIGFDFHAGANDRGDRNRKKWWKNVFGKSVKIQDKSLRVLQDRIVLGANIWAAAGTMILTAAFLIPEGVGLF